MKKFVAYILAIAFWIAPATALDVQDPENEKQKSIHLDSNNPPLQGITRSIIHIPVSAILYTDMDQIEISFDEPEGRAIIQVACMGQVINSYNCNTEEEWIVYLPAPVYPGEYSLIIKTSAAEYIGYFSL